MNNLIITSHGEFCKSLLKSAELILGTQDTSRVSHLCLSGGDNVLNFKKKLEEKINKLNGNNIIILCDLKGGTPFNTSYLLSKSYSLKIIAGMNLPLLLEILINLNNDLSDDKLEEIVENLRGSIELVK